MGGTEGEAIEGGSIEPYTPKVVVKRSDMPRELEEEAVAAISEAFVGNKLEKDVATHLKKAMDAKYPKTSWHCIVGKHFGVSLSYSTRYLIFASRGQHSVLLFKSD